MLADLFCDSGIHISDPHDVLFRIYAVCEDCARRGLVRLGDPAVFAPVDDAVIAPTGQAQVHTPSPPHIMFYFHTESDAEVCLPPPPSLQAAAAAVLELRSLHVRELRPTQPSLQRVQQS